MSRKEDRMRAEKAGPAALAAFREKMRDKKRAQRARRYAMGLGADGKPLKRPEFADPAAPGRHPTDCLCYDCLFPKKNECAQEGIVVYRAIF